MKTTKRILCIALTLVLGLGLLLPATAAEPVDPYAPIITKQPTGPTYAWLGDTFTLEVEAKLPAGIQGELRYNWVYYWTSENGDTHNWSHSPYTGITMTADENKLEVAVSEDLIPQPFASIHCYAQVWYEYEDAFGVTQCPYAVSDTVSVLIAHPYAPKFTRQAPESASILLGGALAIDAAAKLPEGAPGTLSYAWYDYDWLRQGEIRPPVATGPKLELTFDYADLLTLQGWESTTYYPVAINTYQDETGAAQTICTQGNGVRVSGNVIDSAAGPWMMALLGIGCALLIPVATPIAVLCMPIMMFLGPWGMIFVGPFLMPIFGLIEAIGYFLGFSIFG